MQLHSIVNSSEWAKQSPQSFPSTDQAGKRVSTPQPKIVRATEVRTTTATFITPQSLVAFPFASGLVAGMWQATGALGLKDHNYIGFIISLFVGAVVYGITITDRRVKLGRKETLVGMGIGLINCFYLFMAALGLHQVGSLGR
jgi:hypothetical protein